MEFVAVVLLALLGLLVFGGGVLGLVEWRRSVHIRREAEAQAAAAAAAPAPSSPDPWAPVVARRVVVNLNTGRAVDGVLVRREGPLLFLKNAVLLEQGSEPATIDGEAVVQSAHVDFIQAL